MTSGNALADVLAGAIRDKEASRSRSKNRRDKHATASSRSKSPNDRLGGKDAERKERRNSGERSSRSRDNRASVSKSVVGDETVALPKHVK